MQFSTSIWIHIRKAKDTPNSTVSVLFKALCTLDLKPRGAAVIELCPNSCIMHMKQSFLDTKVWLLQNVHISVSCIVVSKKRVFLCGELVQQRFASHKPTLPKVTPHRKQRTFPWHTSATFPVCASFRLMHRHVTLLGLMHIDHESGKYGEKHGFVVICVSLHKGPGTTIGCSVIQHQANSRIILKHRSFNDQQPEFALLCLTICSVAFSLSCSTLLCLNTYQESKTLAK